MQGHRLLTSPLTGLNKFRMLCTELLERREYESTRGGSHAILSGNGRMFTLRFRQALQLKQDGRFFILPRTANAYRCAANFSDQEFAGRRVHKCVGRW